MVEVEAEQVAAGAGEEAEVVVAEDSTVAAAEQEAEEAMMAAAAECRLREAHIPEYLLLSRHTRTWTCKED